MELHTNTGKDLTISTSVGAFSRGAIPTHFITVGENYVELVRRYVLPQYMPGDILSISEKIISLCQGRIIRKEEMRLTPLARFLSRFASQSGAGIGVNCVWKMQFAIDHCGPGRILLASLCAGVGKLFGKRGIFYTIAGDEVRGLDGFYDHSFPEYGGFGIRLPQAPAEVCAEIYQKTGVPSVIVDANDFTCDILGACAAIPYSEPQLAEMLRDNPGGQSDQKTPFVLIRAAG